MRRIYVDFNTLMSAPVDTLKFGPDGDPDIAALKDGERVLVYDEEFEVEATVHYEPEIHYWLGEPDWSTRRDYPEPQFVG